VKPVANALDRTFETYNKVSMEYKRNQVEEAISRVFGERTVKPSLELRTRIKRLLDTDRSLGRNLRSTKPELANYAFYSDESPGKGAEVLFSHYEAFALMTGIRILKHDWPQRFAVQILRQFRDDLADHHQHILRQDSKVLFDKKAIELFVKSSFVDPGNSAPMFLLIVSDSRSRDSKNDVVYAKIFTDHLEAFKFQLEKPGRSCTWFELVTLAHELKSHLSAVQPSKRGRIG
jgi:hypothetical protein